MTAGGNKRAPGHQEVVSGGRVSKSLIAPSGLISTGTDTHTDASVGPIGATTSANRDTPGLVEDLKIICQPEEQLTGVMESAPLVPIFEDESDCDYCGHAFITAWKFPDSAHSAPGCHGSIRSTPVNAEVTHMSSDLRNTITNAAGPHIPGDFAACSSMAWSGAVESWFTQPTIGFMGTGRSHRAQSE